MKIQYDPDADAFYIQLREVTVAHNIDVEEGVTIDFDKDRHERLTPEELANVSFERLSPE